MKHSNYLRPVFDPERLRSTVDMLAALIQSTDLQFDAIAFRGNSGAGVAYPLSYKYGYPLLCVRKPSESSHGFPIESGVKEVNRFIIVDDFICSGETLRRILDTLTEANPNCKCVGIFTYAAFWDSTFSYADIDIPVFGSIN